MELSLCRTVVTTPQLPRLGFGLSLLCYPRCTLRRTSHRLNRFQFSARRPSLRHITVPKATTETSSPAEGTGLYKKLLLPVIDRNPYLSEGTRQAAATTIDLAKKYGAEITVLVIDENPKESINDHDLRIQNIRWHLSQGGFEEFALLESLGEGKLPAAIIGEIADDLNLDLVVLSMESIHSKYVDGNLLPEFVPCPIMLLPL
ncbi:hypothetical protein KP509_19G061000 [Ceratopteris richardii]|uniref:Universal stress protein n=1 Tax=Ceratopteris richardii TaxID=49495 RepID=A0A8T2SMJ0_CERRI|nr:hypothetical protein KP509_19G061000 [Ceratopteris richardii]